MDSLKKTSILSDATFSIKLPLSKITVEDCRRRAASPMASDKGDTDMASRESWYGQLKRSQQYLGLRPLKELIPGLTIPLGSAKCAPCPFKLEPIIVSVSVETLNPHNKITEIGVSVLDTMDLLAIPPGSEGGNWHHKITSSYFRIQDTDTQHEGGSIAAGDRFDLTKGGLIGLSSMRMVLRLLFDYVWPISSSLDGKTLEARSVILVCNHPVRLTAALKRFGFNPYTIPNIVEVVDARRMFCALTRDATKVPLLKALHELNIPECNSHNVGTDARYGLQMMIAIAFRQTKMNEEGFQTQTSKQRHEALNSATAAVLEEFAQWNEAEQRAEAAAKECDDAPHPAAYGGITTASGSSETSEQSWPFASAMSMSPSSSTGVSPARAHTRSNTGAVRFSDSKTFVLGPPPSQNAEKGGALDMASMNKGARKQGNSSHLKAPKRCGRGRGGRGKHSEKKHNQRKIDGKTIEHSIAKECDQKQGHASIGAMQISHDTIPSGWMLPPGGRLRTGAKNRGLRRRGLVPTSEVFTASQKSKSKLPKAQRTATASASKTCKTQSANRISKLKVPKRPSATNTSAINNPDTPSFKTSSTPKFSETASVMTCSTVKPLESNGDSWDGYWGGGVALGLENS